MHKTAAINCSTTVPAGGSESLTFRFENDGQITSIYATAYPGEETAVERYFRLWKGGKSGGDGHYINLLTPADGSVSYLAGDDENWTFSLERAFEPGDELEVKYINTNSTNEYPVTTLIEADHGPSLYDRLSSLL